MGSLEEARVERTQPGAFEDREAGIGQARMRDNSTWQRRGESVAVMRPGVDHRAPMTVLASSGKGARSGGLSLFVQFAGRAFRAWERARHRRVREPGQAGTMFALWRKRLSGSQVRLILRSLANRSGPKAAATRAAV